jgi:ankyrin repeat protein
MIDNLELKTFRKAYRCFKAIENHSLSDFEIYYNPDLKTTFLKNRKEEGIDYLQYAITCKSWEIFRFLLRKGYKFRRKDNNGNTCLHYLAQNCDDVNKLKALLARGADPDILNKAGDSPALHALLFHNYRMMAGLFNKDYKNASGQTLLTLAIERKDWAAVDLLIDIGHFTDPEFNGAMIPFLIIKNCIFVLDEEIIDILVKLKRKGCDMYDDKDHIINVLRTHPNFYNFEPKYIKNIIKKLS